MLQERVVLCMKWGSLYSPDYVNVLFSAVGRNLDGPFRFVCVTDDAIGLAAGIETYPIPEIGLGAGHWRGGAWPKLSVFKPDLFGLTGRALFIDLDSVVVGPLEPMFEVGGFRAIGGGPDWKPGRIPAKPRLLTGVFGFDLGSMAGIVDAFATDPGKALDECRIEQRFVESQVESWKPWPAEWVISFKRHLRQPMLLDRFRAPKPPPKAARIVAFHGEPRPLQLVEDGGRWGSFPRYGRGAVQWMRDYWIENGGGDLHSQSGSER